MYFSWRDSNQPKTKLEWINLKSQGRIFRTFNRVVKWTNGKWFILSWKEEPTRVLKYTRFFMCQWRKYIMLLYYQLSVYFSVSFLVSMTFPTTTFLNDWWPEGIRLHRGQITRRMDLQRPWRKERFEEGGGGEPV